MPTASRDPAAAAGVAAKDPTAYLPRRDQIVLATLMTTPIAVVILAMVANADVGDLAVGLPIAAALYLVLRLGFARWQRTATRGLGRALPGLDPEGRVQVVANRAALAATMRELGEATGSASPVAAGRRAAWIGMVAGALGMVIVAGVLGLDRGLIVLLTLLALPLLAFARYTGRVWLWRRRTRGELLDADVVGPWIAIYARVHGTEAALAGIPAEDLRATLADQPGLLAAAARMTRVGRTARAIVAGAAA